jgi:hypothetical protein
LASWEVVLAALLRILSLLKEIMIFRNSNFIRTLTILTVVFLIVCLFFPEFTYCNGVFSVKKLNFLHSHSVLNDFPCFKNGLGTLQNKYVVCNTFNEHHFWVLTHKAKEKALMLGSIDIMCNNQAQFMNIHSHIGHPDLTFLKHVDIKSLPCLENYHDQICKIVTNEDSIKNSFNIPNEFKKDLLKINPNKLIGVNKDFISLIKNIK